MDTQRPLASLEAPPPDSWTGSEFRLEVSDFRLVVAVLWLRPLLVATWQSLAVSPLEQVLDL